MLAAGAGFFCALARRHVSQSSPEMPDLILAFCSGLRSGAAPMMPCICSGATCPRIEWYARAACTALSLVTESVLRPRAMAATAHASVS